MIAKINELKSNIYNLQDKNVNDDVLNNKLDDSNGDYFDRKIKKHKPVVRRSMNPILQDEQTSEIISELKNENKELYQTIEVLKKKISENLNLNSKWRNFFILHRKFIQI